MTGPSLGEKRVCVAGCGGLGGYVLEYLLRLGVGHLTAVDGDRFDESNLDRQLLCRQSTLGQNKAQAARDRALSIFPGADVTAWPVFLDEKNGPGILAGHDLVMDALDSAAARRLLALLCEGAGIPLIHGAICGRMAQAAVLLPGRSGMARLYPGDAEPRQDKTLPYTPALCAALQVALAERLLLGETDPLAGELLTADLTHMEFTRLPFGGGE